MAMSNTSSLAPWKIHNRFVDIIRNDACHILGHIPSYDSVRFDYSQPETPVALRLGEYGDSEILAHPNGSVTKHVTRGSKIGKAGTIMEVNRPMSKQFKAVVPFCWIDRLKEGVSTPMSAPTHALVLMYMHIWALETGKQGVDLPIPGYQSLYEALVSIRNALETEQILPVEQRKIPAKVLGAYQPGAVDKFKLAEEDMKIEET